MRGLRFLQIGLAATTALAWTPQAAAKLAAVAQFNYPDVLGGITSDQYDLVKDVTIVSATQYFIVGWGTHEDRTTKTLSDANAYTQAFVEWRWPSPQLIRCNSASVCASQRCICMSRSISVAVVR